MHPGNRGRLAAAVFFSLASAAATEALAQQQGKGDAGAGLEEVVVTATKRATTVQETPMSLTAITGEDIQERGLPDFAAIVQAVPELIAMATAIAGSRGDNTTALAIQWQGADAPAIAADPSIVSTQTVPEGEVTSRIDSPAAAPAAGPDDPFDEDDIEKAIAEIRDAIEKSSQILK